MGKLEGLDIESNEEKDIEKVPSIEVVKKRLPFHEWEVGGVAYRLKLNTAMVTALENKYNTSLLNLVSVDGLPPLSVMLTIIQGALSPWRHGMNFNEVQKLYDSWVNEGGNQVELFSKVVMPTLAVSGFFTQTQADAIMESLENMDALM